MYLVDTNVWLEALLDQERADEAREFTGKTPSAQVAITEFSLYSIGVILLRLKKNDLLRTFLREVILSAQTPVIRLSASELEEVIGLHERLNLDFDDSYQ